jgi:hypothetical protein
MRSLEELGQLESMDQMTDEERAWVEEETRDWFANIRKLVSTDAGQRQIQISPRAFVEHMRKKDEQRN